jgi:glycosyltransferase involved in cell wall biosynthesis
MRVTHVITRLVIGGAQENTVSTVLGLRERPGIEIELLSGPTTGPEGSMESSFASCPELLKIVPPLVRPVHPWKDLLALSQLTRHFRGRPPDLVHTHSGKAGVLGRLAARRAGVPVIVHHIHGPSFGEFQGPLANSVFLSAERLAARATTHFVCSANAMTRRYLAAGIGRPEMYTRVFSGFRLERFLAAVNDPALRARLGFAADDFIIGKIARLAPLKGHDDLLRAFAQLVAASPAARLLFVGDGPLRSQLESRVRQLGLSSKVIFAGLVPPADVARFIGIMDCVVHLSFREALSRALPQALAAAKPIIAYDFDGADEVCFDGETGFLVRTGNVSAVTARLLELAKNPALRQRLGNRGRQIVSENFPVEKMIEDLYQLYLRLVATQPGAPGAKQTNL